MVQIKYTLKSIVLIFLLIRTVGVFSRDLSERDRALRADFIQNLLNQQKKLEGRIKLKGGPNEFEGNVYIYHAGRWGAVCDDSWDDAAASVVCRTFNKTGVATKGGQYGEATEKFWLDDVICQGDELSLSKCVFNRWGSSDCEPDEAAGVKCMNQSEIAENLLKANNKRKKLFELLDVSSTSLRLIGGKDNKEGRVEIYHNGTWGSICPDGWTLYEASVVCRHLALGYASQALQTYHFGFSKIMLSGVDCDGDETNLFQCMHEAYGDVTCPGDVGNAAAVVCTQTLADLVLDTSAIERSAHLQDVMMFHLKCAMEENCLSKTAYEIYHNGTWGSICPDGWTLYEASVVCRHLALGYASQALQTYHFGFSKIMLSGVDCDGDETNLFQCMHEAYGDVTCPGDVGNAAAVVCTQTLADLVLDTSAIERSAHLQDVMMFHLKCAMEENCLSKTAYEIQKSNPDWQFETRRLLRFTASSLNTGNAEFRPYLPKHLWQWHLCHMHYHSMEVFATFDILDALGRRIAEGHKASFCLEDNTCLPGIEKKYSCRNYGDQGISVNCSDVYLYNIDCQWVDVTDVEPGDYTFKVAVNPHARVAEQSFHNNAASCQLRLSDTYAMVFGCKLERP